MVELFANSGDADQTPRSAASDLGLHCLPNTLLGVSRLQWIIIVLLPPLYCMGRVTVYPNFEVGTSVAFWVHRMVLDTVLLSLTQCDFAAYQTRKGQISLCNCNDL